MNQKTVLKKVLRRIRRYWAGVAASVVLATVYVVMTLYIPILVGNAIDCIVDMGRVDFTAMKGFLWKVIGCSFTAAVSQWVMSQINNRMTYRVTQDIRDEAFRHIQVLPLSYLDAHPQGDVVSRVISDVDTFADGLLMGFTQLFTGVMTILGTLVFMLRIHWAIALVVICVTPLSLVVANFIATRTYSMFRKQTVTRGEQTGLIDETIGQMKVVQAFGHQAQTMEQFDEVNERLKKCSLRAIFFSSLTNPCTRFVNSVVYALVGLTGALAAIAGGITVGNLTSFLNYANQYTKPFNEISGVITELQNALACAGRVFELIEAPARSPEPENPQRPEVVKGRVEIKDLRFSYVPEKPLIDDRGTRTAGSHCRPNRLRKNHFYQSSDALLRPSGWADPSRWSKHPEYGSGRAEKMCGHGAAGYLAEGGNHSGEYCHGKTGCDGRTGGYRRKAGPCAQLYYAAASGL